MHAPCGSDGGHNQKHVKFQLNRFGVFEAPGGENDPPPLTWLIANMQRINENEKALRGVQTLRAGCSKAEPKICAPPQTPFQGVRDGHNLISWRLSLPLSTIPIW